MSAAGWAAPLLVADLAPAVDGIRMIIHVTAAAIWVGGQFTLAGLVPTARSAGPDVPKKMARAFARVSWPAYFVLVATGFWNVAAVSKGQPKAWQAVLGIKIIAVALAGIAALLHSRATSRRALAAWGALSALGSLGALALGVFLAG